MPKCRDILLLIACGVVAVVVYAVLTRNREPSYGGRRLSQWLNGYNAEASEEARRQTEDAISRIGANGVPWLLKWISYEEMPWKTEIRRAVNALPAKTNRKDLFITDPQYVRAEQAARAFATLGPNAGEAVADLTRMMNDPEAANRSGRATFALTHVGGKALIPLITALTNHQAPARRVAANWFYCLGTNARPAVPVLIQCLSDSDSEVARGAARSLGNLRLEPSITVPALALCLSSVNNGAQPEAAAALGKFGAEALPAVPALLTARNHSWFPIRKAATNALLKIAPEALTNAPSR